MTLQDCLAQGVALLSAGPHPDRARLDAETLLLHHIGRNKAWLMAHGMDSYAGCSAIGYAAMLERRRKGEPIQYITGECEFYGLPFRVTPDVLIPRSETEHLVDKCLTLAANLGAPSIPPGAPGPDSGTRESNDLHLRLCILDIGTGSGAISVALAHKLPHVHITATDLSPHALALAKQNAERNHVADRIRFLRGDLLTPVAGEQFDIIVSNPPYVPETDRLSLSVEVRDYEPALALFAGKDGLDIYRRLIPQAFAALISGGSIALEIGYGQQDAIRDLLSAVNFQNIGFTPDLQGISRVANAEKN